MKSANRWVDAAINAKIYGEANGSWWLEPQSREAFDREVEANLGRMQRSRFGRMSVRTTEQSYGDGLA